MVTPERHRQPSLCVLHPGGELAPRQGTGNVGTGLIHQNSGPRFDAYDTTKVMADPVGTATFASAGGNNATFAYVVMVAPFPGPITQTKPITRFPFAATGGTVCNQR